MHAPLGGKTLLYITRLGANLNRGSELKILAFKINNLEKGFK